MLKTQICVTRPLLCVNPECISSLFWFLCSTLCLSFLHASVSVFFPFFITPASLYSSCSHLKSFTCIIPRFISCLTLSPSLCKTFIFLANSSVHSILSCFRHLCFVSVLLPFSPSFCLYFLYRVSVPCDCLPSVDAEPILSVSPCLQNLSCRYSLACRTYLVGLPLPAEPILSVSPYLQNLSCQSPLTCRTYLVSLPLPAVPLHWYHPHCLGSLGQWNENSAYHASWKWKI